MSELINRIYDVEAISKEVTTILEALAKVQTNIDSFNASIKGISDATRKAKGVEDLSKNAKDLNDIVVKGGVEMKRWEAEVQKLDEKTKQLTTSEKQAAIEIAKARLELQAAQKATKDAALAEIEATAATKHLAGSYDALNEDLKKAVKSYKAMSDEERNSAQGKELLKKINDTNTALKATDASMGNYQRNVGNYSEAFKPLMGTFENLMKTQGKLKDSAANMMGFFSGSKSGFEAFSQGVGISDESLKVLAKNPIMAIITILVTVFNALKDAIGGSSKATNTLKEAMAPLNAVMQIAKNVTLAIVQVFLDAFLAISKFTTAIYEFVAGNDKYSKSVKEAAQIEKERQALAKNARKLLEEEAKGNLEVAKLRDKVTEKDKYSRKEREKFLREAIAIEKRMAEEKRIQAIKEYNNLVKDQRKKADLSKEDKDAKTAAFTKMYEVEKEFYDKTRRMKTQAATFNITEDAAEAKAKEEAINAQKEHTEKIIASRRRLIDSQLALMEEGKEKQIAISNETYNRQIDDLKRNGELTKALSINLQKSHKQELQKINDEFRAKDLNDSIKADELVIENMRRNGEDTLNYEKALLEKKKQSEILAGGDIEAIREKYRFQELDLIAKNADEKAILFEKELTKRADKLAMSYLHEEKDIKAAYSRGEISEKEYQDAIAEIKQKALFAANDMSIKALEDELKIAELSADKRAELEKKLAQLKIDNENAHLDATIKANNDKVASDKAATEKRIQIAQELASVTQEVFGAIADFQRGKSEARIQELEAEQEANNKKFDEEQSKLDGAIMSDEARAQKQKELNDKKAASEKAIQDKIKAEKIKMAKWDKAQALIGAIANTAQAVMKVFAQTGVLGFITSGLVAAAGAIQVATIAAQPIPAFAKGTDSTPKGLALWGEVQPEVAVTPTGETYLAERPTISNFDAGTRIYKSVADYEKAMSSTGAGRFEFDYDKMGEKMKAPNIVLDSRGLWGIVSQQNSRRTMINRRYTL
jgi:hypothetical protein